MHQPPASPAQAYNPSSGSSSGTLTLTAICKDLAGNTGTASHRVQVDLNAPVITGHGQLRL